MTITSTCADESPTKNPVSAHALPAKGAVRVHLATKGLGPPYRESSGLNELGWQVPHPTRPEELAGLALAHRVQAETLGWRKSASDGSDFRVGAGECSMCAGDDHNCPQFDLRRKQLLDDLDAERRELPEGRICSNKRRGGPNHGRRVALLTLGGPDRRCAPRQTQPSLSPRDG